MQRDSTFPYYEPCSFPLHRFDLHSFKQCITTTNKKYIDEKTRENLFLKKKLKLCSTKSLQTFLLQTTLQNYFQKNAINNFSKMFFLNQTVVVEIAPRPIFSNY